MDFMTNLSHYKPIKKALSIALIRLRSLLCGIESVSGSDRITALFTVNAWENRAL
jgi:hypothetical protein